MSLMSLVLVNWRDMNRPLRISVVMGLISGAEIPIVLLVFFGSAYASLAGFAYLFWFSLFSPLFALFTIPPWVSLTGTIVLLLVRMNPEKRGVVGFIVFTASLPSIFVMLDWVAYLSGLSHS